MRQWNCVEGTSEKGGNEDFLNEKVVQVLSLARLMPRWRDRDNPNPNMYGHSLMKG